LLVVEQGVRRRPRLLGQRLQLSVPCARRKSVSDTQLQGGKTLEPRAR